MTPEVIGLLLTVAAMGGAGFIAWGRLKAEHSGLEQRHAENSAEFRSAIGSLDKRIQGVERVQGTVDIHLDNIRSQLADIKALLSAPSPRKRT